MSGKKGFSLIQAMVAMFIFSILSLGAMEMMANFAKYMKYTEQKEAVDDFVKLLKTNFKSPDSCRCSFSYSQPNFTLGSNAPYSTSDERIGQPIYDKCDRTQSYTSRIARWGVAPFAVTDYQTSTHAARLITKLGTSGVTFYTILMKDLQMDAGSDTDPDIGEGVATVEVVFKKDNPSSSFGGEYIKREFPLVDVSLYTQDDVDNGAASGLKDTVKSCSYFADEASRLPVSTPPPTTSTNCPAQTGITKTHGTTTITIGDVAESPIGTALPLSGSGGNSFCMGTYKCKTNGSWEDNVACIEKPFADPLYTYAIHSQTTSIPSCPTGYTSLWTGYSHAYSAYSSHGDVDGEGLSHSGSCLKEFRFMPITECSNTWCDHGTGNDYSAWLYGHTSETSYSNMNLTTSSSRVARCRVCQGSKPLLTFHSQTKTIPSCPSGYSSVWTGWSFYAATITNEGGASSGLSSPGSCLKRFRPNVLMECEYNLCRYKSSYDYTVWMSARTADSSQRSGQTALNNERDEHISRCRVCRKN